MEYLFRVVHFSMIFYFLKPDEYLFFLNSGTNYLPVYLLSKHVSMDERSGKHFYKQGNQMGNYRVNDWKNQKQRRPGLQTRNW